MIGSSNYILNFSPLLLFCISISRMTINDSNYCQDTFSNPSSHKVFGTIIYKAIEDDDIDSLTKLTRELIVTKNFPSFYPGIVTYCVKRTLRHGTDDRTISLWVSWVPSDLRADDKKYSLIALNKLHEITGQKQWLADLSLKLMNTMGNENWSELIPFIVSSLPTVCRVSDNQLAHFSAEIKAEVVSHLTQLELSLNSERNCWDSHEQLLDIGRRDSLSTEHLVADTRDTLESIMTACLGIPWLCFVEIVQRLDWRPSTADEDYTFPNMMIGAIRGESNIASSFKSLTNRNCYRFLILFSLAISGVTRKNFFKFSPFLLLKSDVEVLEQIRLFVCLKYETHCLLEKYKEQIFDSIMLGIRNGTVCDSEIGHVVSALLDVGLDHSVLIDLVRDLVARYEPRSCPIWVLEIFLAVSAGLRSSTLMIEDTASVDESTLLVPTELVAIEMIDYVKYFIDISDDTTTNDPTLIANNCFIKSAFSMRILNNCLRVFLQKYSQIFIVKLCDFWDILSVFFPSNLVGNENKIRALFALEIMVLTVENESVKEFFEDRINRIVFPVLDNCSLDDPIGAKISLLVKILFPDKYR